jgi:hypothetical protein
METEMNGRIPERAAKMAAAALAAVVLCAMAAGAAGAEVIYNNLPGKSLPALGFESDSVWEFGGEVQFAGTARNSPTVAVELESYACQTGSVATCTTGPGTSFEWPITLSVYNVGSLGSPIARITKTFKIPYRPSENAKCPNVGWSKGYGMHCYFAKGVKIKFKLPGATLPAQAVIGVAYNTETYGSEPTGQEGPYNSLNVAVNANYQCIKENPMTKACENEEYEALATAPSVGTDPLPEQVFLNTTYSAIDCGGTLGSFGPSGKCWKYEQPAFEVSAK